MNVFLIEIVVISFAVGGVLGGIVGAHLVKRA